VCRTAEGRSGAGATPDPVADVEAVARDTDWAIAATGDRVAGIRQHVVADDFEVLDLRELVERLAQGANDRPRCVLDGCVHRRSEGPSALVVVIVSLGIPGEDAEQEGSRNEPDARLPSPCHDSFPLSLVASRGRNVLRRLVRSRDVSGGPEASTNGGSRTA